MRGRRSWNVAAAALLGLCLALPGCRSKEAKYDYHFGRAKDYEQGGKVEEALIEYRNALQAKPTDAEVNFRIAELLARQGKFTDAVFFYNETLRLDAARDDAALAEAKLLLFDDPQRAGKLIDGVIEHDPANWRGYHRRSELDLAKGDADGALTAALTAVQLAPKEGLAYYQLGVVHQARVRALRVAGKPVPDEVYQAALDAFEKADQAYGGNVMARLQRMKVYASWEGHRKEASQEARDAIELAKQKGVPAERAGAARTALDFAGAIGDDDLRAAALDELVAADPGALDAWEELARRADAKDGSGEQVYQRLLQARPKDVRAHIRYATYLLQRGRVDEGFAYLGKVADQGIDPPVALDALVRLELNAGKIDAAREVVARLEREHADAPETVLARSRLALFERRPEDAASSLRKLVGRTESGEAQRLLAVAEFQSGHLPAATAAVDRALTLGTDVPAETLRLKILIESAARDWTATLQTLQQLGQSGPLAPDMSLVLAQTLYEVKRPADGRRVLEGLQNEPSVATAAAVEFARREGASDPDASKRYLEAALARSPGSPVLVGELTRLDLGRGDSAGALKRLDAALAGSEPDPGLLLMRAQVRMALHQLEGAQEDAQRAVERDPHTPGAFDLLIGIYSARGKLDEAVKSLQEADKAGTLQAGPRALLGRILLSRGDSVAAKPLLEQALAERPDLADAKNDLAYLLARDGTDLDRALQLAQEAQQALPNVPEVADTLGYVYLRKGLNEAAIEQFRFAIDLSEQAKRPQAALEHHLGLALRAAGRNEEAAAAFEKALAIDAHFPDADAARKELEAVRASAHQAPPNAS